MFEYFTIPTGVPETRWYNDVYTMWLLEIKIFCDACGVKSMGLRGVVGRLISHIAP